MQNKSLKFTVFADFHYKKEMYATTVDDMNLIFERANKFGAELVLSLGDLCNDFKGSPELINAFLNNQYSLPVYNIYGNHELETDGNVMDLVTPLLTNAKVNFNGKNGYYYFDKDEYRFICLDTNYSYNKELDIWEHNKEASWGAPSDNVNKNALSPDQLKWFEEIINLSVEENKKCIICSHACLTFYPEKIYETDKILEIINRANSVKKKTVIMAINGHYHTDNFEVLKGVCYFDVNTVKNGFWSENFGYHYQKGQGFDLTYYDGLNKKETKFFDFNDLKQGKNTWFFDKPLSCDIEITSDGEIIINGTKSNWCYGVKPPVSYEVSTSIKNRKVKV